MSVVEGRMQSGFGTVIVRGMNVSPLSNEALYGCRASVGRALSQGGTGDTEHIRSIDISDSVEEIHHGLGMAGTSSS